jgi:hypothetical protein
LARCRCHLLNVTSVTGEVTPRVSEYVRELVSGELLAEVDGRFEVVKKR